MAAHVCVCCGSGARAARPAQEALARVRPASADGRRAALRLGQGQGRRQRRERMDEAPTGGRLQRRHGAACAGHRLLPVSDQRAKHASSVRARVVVASNGAVLRLVGPVIRWALLFVALAAQ